jgi:hypothetical protein
MRDHAPLRYTLGIMEWWSIGVLNFLLSDFTHYSISPILQYSIF